MIGIERQFRCEPLECKYVSRPSARAADARKIRERRADRTSVLLLLAAAAKACREQKIDTLVECLRSAVAIYEAHPTHAQAERSQLPALLTWVIPCLLALVDGGNRIPDARRIDGPRMLQRHATPCIISVLPCGARCREALPRLRSGVRDFFPAPNSHENGWPLVHAN